MAGGWARDDAVNEQIEVSTKEAIERARQRAQAQSARESAEFCVECDEPIPPARRAAVPGVQLCVACQRGADRRFRPAAGINRRGSKDLQMK